MQREAEERQRQKLQAAESKARQLEASLRRKESAVLRLQVPAAWPPRGGEDGNGLISRGFVSREENATKIGLSRRKPNRSSPPRTWRRASRSAWTTPAATTSPSTGRAAWPGAPRCPNGASGREPRPLPAPSAPVGKGIVGQTGSGEGEEGKRSALWWNRVVSRRPLSSCSGFLRSLGFDLASCCGVVPRTRCPAAPWYLPAPVRHKRRVPAASRGVSAPAVNLVCVILSKTQVRCVLLREILPCSCSALLGGLPGSLSPSFK